LHLPNLLKERLQKDLQNQTKAEMPIRKLISNEELIKSICDEFHELIIQPGHINNFESRMVTGD
jgi:hypothetical protein